MLSRRALAQFAAVALLFVLGFSALALLVADSGEAGASTVSAVAPVSAARPAPSAESRNPYGEMNLAWTEPGMIGVVGWAKDPDVNRPIDVVVAIDNGGGLHVRTAGVYNPFLPGSYGEKFRSYLVAIPVTPGPHTMCVAALNVGRGTGFRLLGCKVFDNVMSADPVGNLEVASLTPDGDRVDMSGWAVDLENGIPLPMTLTVDGAPASRVVASENRPDVARFFPSSGPARGFTGQVAVTAGVHRVCAVAQNVGRGSDAPVGCSVIDVPRSQPIGVLEAMSVGTNAVDVAGWAGDPDAGGPIDIAVSTRLVGGIDDSRLSVWPAANPRSDVAAATGLDQRAGFSTSVPVSAPGTYEVCVAAVNRGRGRNQSLGCRNVVVDDHRPIGNIERIAPQGFGVQVSGWTFDPDAGGTVTVSIAVDGNVTDVLANQSRSDVAAVIPAAGPNRGFTTTIGGLAAGRHSVCVTLRNVGSNRPGLNGDLAPPCGSVIVGATAVGTTGTAGIPIPIGPSGPLSDVDRDAGVTTTLRDGSLLWLFGDSIGFNPDGSMRYFVSGTGAWASATSPTVTRDAITPSNTPYLLADPGSGFVCPSSMPHQAMWPLSATTVPAGSRDRVIVFLANMCLADATHFEAKGIAIAEWYYDPADPPAERPVQLNVLNPNVGLARAYGTASVMGSDGFLYLYQCDRPANPIDVANFGPCRVARVAPAGVADVSQYRYWNGSSWSVSDPNVPISMPAGSLLGYRYPASAFTVVFDSAHGVYVMVYSPWPGFVDRAMVRVARTPQGPWSEPVEVNFPGCNNSVGGQTKSCYAGTAQPAFSTTSELGLGYYDQAIPADRNRGQYMVVRVPFVVTLS